MCSFKVVLGTQRGIFIIFSTQSLILVKVASLELISRDKDANPHASPQPAQVKLDRVLTKAVSQCSQIINDHLRSALKVKLWCIVKALFCLNSRQRKVLQEKWKQH